jgi:GH15 family glucan-1,4-alpha-glucosidase
LTASRHVGPSALEDYALIGDGVTAALVSRAGSVDWLCWPRFDSPACFAALLGTPENGCWSVAPAQSGAQIRREYRRDTMVLETVFTTEHGEVGLIDFMAVGEEGSHLVRLLQGRRGVIAVDMQLSLRFGYGATPPVFEPLADRSGIAAIAGANLVTLRTPVVLQESGLALAASVTVAAGQIIPFVLSYGASGVAPPQPIDPLRALERTELHWHAWSQRGSYAGPHADAVRRSLLVLKALTYEPTGAMVAAPTTSLPEQAGGSRNWDYRYCWLRDSALAVLALLDGGHTAEPLAWRDWLLRVTSAQVQIMYGVGGERDLREWQADWLPGYQGARPVRIGNAAHGQLQLDVFGEIATALHRLNSNASWALQLELTEQLIGMIGEPDEGIWETRGGRRHFTHSKVMAWVALDRAIASAERFSLPAPIERWKASRADLHALICDRGFDRRLHSFVQSFGSDRLDASLLLLPAVGFLPADDPRVAGTIAAIEHILLRCGLVQRYDTGAGEDGLPPGEGAFLACSFWLVDCYTLQGRLAEAHQLFERLLALRNDVGLLSEQYDTKNHRLVGNFPQAFSHLALINSAVLLARSGQPAPRSADASRPCDQT